MANILVIDDDQGVLQLLKIILSNEGHQVFVAAGKVFDMMQGGTKAGPPHGRSEDNGEPQTVQRAAVFFRVKDGIPRELIAIRQSFSLMQPIRQIFGVDGIVMDGKQQIGPPSLGDGGPSCQRDVVAALIYEERPFKPLILFEFFVQTGGDVFIECQSEGKRGIF